MTEKIPVVFGEVLFDCFDDGSRVLGGAPFNVAWHLQAFGCRPLFISRVGDDALGAQIRATMQQWGMPTAGLQTDPHHPTGEVRVTLERGQPSFEILPDRAYDHISPDGLPSMQPSLLYHGTLALRQDATAGTLSELLRRYDTPVFMDVNLRDPWWDKDHLERLLQRASWVKINDIELDALVQEAGNLSARAALLLQRHRLEWVIVTLGAKGAFALEQSGQRHEISPAAEVPVVDTVGAGDAFASVCILGQLQGWPLPLILERAQRFASVLVGRRGATIEDFAIYRPLLQNWQLLQQAQ